jgi:ABC-type branched-subunit amino acid transport system permease subunit
MNVLHRWSSAALTVAAVVAIAILTTVLPGFRLSLGTQLFAYIIICLSANLLFGYADEIVLAQAAIVGFGSYGFAVAVNAGIPLVLAALVAIALSSVGSVLLAFPALRLQGLFLAIITLAFQFAFSGAAEGWRAVTGGLNGIAVNSLFTAPVPGMETERFWFLAAGVLAVLVVLAMRRLVRGPFGRGLAALRDAPEAAAALGMRALHWKLVTFALAGGISGIGAVLLVGRTAYVSPGSYTVQQSMLVTVAIIVGGVASITGSVLAAVIVVGLPELLFALGASAELTPVIIALTIVLCLRFLPRGIVSLPGLVEGRLRRARAKEASS